MHTRAFEQLWMVLGRNRPVAIHRNLITLSGSAKAALFLSQLAYWTRRSEAARATGGWIHKSAAQWELELGLSWREQSSSRRVLRTLQLLEEERRGLPALPYYRLRLRSLGRQLAGLAALPAIDLSLETFLTNEALVRSLLGGPIPYHRVLAYLTESVHAALLLTRIIHAHRRHLAALGWAPFRREELQQHLGLTRWEQEGARHLLRSRGLIEERLEYVPLCLYARSVPERLLSLLLDLSPSRRALAPEAGRQDVGKADHSEEEKRKTNCGNSREFDSRKTSTQFRGKPPLPLVVNQTTGEELTTTTAGLDDMTTAGTVVVVDEAQSGKAIRERLTVRHSDLSRTDPTDHGEDIDAGTAACLTVRQPDLVFPEDFLPVERELALRELCAVAPARRQLILDELEGRQSKGRRVDSRVGLVRALARAEREGRFAPGYAWEVGAARERHARCEAERQARERQQRAEADALSAAVCSRIGGKRGYEAFKEFAAHCRRSPGNPGRREDDNEGTA